MLFIKSNCYKQLHTQAQPCSMYSQTACCFQLSMSAELRERFCSFSLIGCRGPIRPSGSILRGILGNKEKSQVGPFVFFCSMYFDISHCIFLKVNYFCNNTSVSSQTRKLQFCKTFTKASLIITRANRIPRQFRGPIPNGR